MGATASRGDEVPDLLLESSHRSRHTNSRFLGGPHAMRDPAARLLNAGGQRPKTPARLLGP